MVRYELGNGKTILLTWEEYENLTPEKISEYIARDSGMYIDNPLIDFYEEDDELDELLKKFEDLDVQDLPKEEIERIRKELED